MASISPASLAQSLLDACLQGAPEPEEALNTLVDWALSEDEGLAISASRALFGVLAEGLADRFEPDLCRIYARLFSRVLAQADPRWKDAELQERYESVHKPRLVEGDPEDVYVLSRVTLGADVAITSVVLDGARQRFPASNIWLAGPSRSRELFAGSLRLKFLELEYGRRGTLRERLAVYEPLREALNKPGAVLLDPDSRLSQLGLLPVCPPECHFLFESRAYGGDSERPLPELTSRWVEETLGVEGAAPWLHPKLQPSIPGQPMITVNLGVGENPAKRVGGQFEVDLLRRLARTGALVMVDTGAPGSEEEGRVRAAVETAGQQEGNFAEHRGSFASFASLIASSSLYVGYDSAGQHVAAALGVPLITVFAGYPCRRMLARWSPGGPGPCRVIAVQPYDTPADILERVEHALTALMP